jgi:hypothetical protein
MIENKILSILKSSGYGITGREIHNQLLKEFGNEAPCAGDVASTIWSLINKNVLALNVDMTLSIV